MFTKRNILDYVYNALCKFCFEIYYRIIVRRNFGKTLFGRGGEEGAALIEGQQVP